MMRMVIIVSKLLLVSGWIIVSKLVSVCFKKRLPFLVHRFRLLLKFLPHVAFLPVLFPPHPPLLPAVFLVPLHLIAHCLNCEGLNSFVAVFALRMGSIDNALHMVQEVLHSFFDVIDSLTFSDLRDLT